MHIKEGVSAREFHVGTPGTFGAGNPPAAHWQ